MFITLIFIMFFMNIIIKTMPMIMLDRIGRYILLKNKDTDNGVS